MTAATQVVQRNSPRVGPEHQYRMIQLRGTDDRFDFTGPTFGIPVELSVQRFVGTTMAPNVIGDEPEFLGQRPADLFDPGEVRLRIAMYQEHVPPRPCARPVLSGNAQAVRRAHL